MGFVSLGAFPCNLSMLLTITLLFAIARCQQGHDGCMRLDGEWNFSLLGSDAIDVPSGASSTLPYSSTPTLLQKGTIQVPGSWEAQGYGSETMQMRWQVLTGDNAAGA